MKKLCCFATILVAMVLVASLGIRNSSPVFATVLDGFAINTEDKAVTVTLYTDQRAQYTTENQGKQFSIILPETQLSKEQLENGLPVVIDNKNKIIGRAVPTEDGHVKIVLPNLPVNEYAISIQQKKIGQSALSPMALVNPAPVRASNPVSAIRPRASVNPSDSQFEQVASKIIQQAEVSKLVPTAAKTMPVYAPTPIKLGPTPVSTAYGGSRSIWNPYVIKPEPLQSQKKSARPASSSKNMQITEDPVNTLSIAEPTNTQGGKSDPLWYLHSLPPVNPSQAPVDNLQGLALDSSGLMQSSPQVVAQGAAMPIIQQPALKSVITDLKDVVLSLPKWLLILMVVFMGGISLFTVVGSLVLMKVLFTQMRHGAAVGMNTVPPYLAYHPVIPPMSQGVDHTPNGYGQGLKPSSYATQPERQQVSFKDTALFNAMDYLKEAPENVAEAVHNAVLIKFPTHQKRKMGTRKHIKRRVGAVPI